MTDEKKKMAQGNITVPPKRSPGRGRYDRSQTKEERKEEQRVTILESTMHVLIREGYSQTTVSKICNEAKMSRATFYNHYRGLREVVLALHDDVADFVFEHVESATTQASDDYERLRRGVESFMEIIGENPDEARVMFREIRSAGPSYEARHEEKFRRFVDKLKQDVEKAFRAGLLSRMPTEDVIIAIVGGMEAVAMRYVLSERPEDVAQSVPAMIELVTRVLL